MAEPKTSSEFGVPVKFKTGETIAQSGIYRVVHKEHRLPHEVTLVRGEMFPPCSKCASAVRFKLLRPVNVEWGKIVLNELPELPELHEPDGDLQELDLADTEEAS